MNKFIKRVARIIFFFSYIFFIICLVAVTSILILKNNEYVNTLENYNNIQNTVLDANKQINSTKTESTTQIEKLQQEITALSQENKELKSDIATLNDTKESSIQGKITGQILLGQDNLSNYQLVCAQNTTDTHKIYCVSTSSYITEFKLAVPAGKYIITAKVLDKDNHVALVQYTGKYTEYVKCLTEKGSDTCDAALSQKQITVEVKKGQKVVNINPVDWN